jgi:hypothetical protein
MRVVRTIGYGIAAALKWLSMLLFTFSGGALVTLGVYDLLEYEPRRAEIQALLERAAPAERSPPPVLRDLQRADARGQVHMRATRVVLHELDRDALPMQTLQRMRRQLIWTQLGKVHLAEEEQLLIERSRIFLGQRSYGFEAGARSVFGRPLDRLSDQELAELVVIARWPSRFRDPIHSADRAKAASALLAQVRSAR